MKHGAAAPVRKSLAALGLGVLVGCAPQPFDATAPHVPSGPAEGQSFAGGFSARPPGSAFETFEAQQGASGDVRVPGRGGENPWATQPENVVVQVCFSSLLNTAAAVKQTARDLCPAGARLRLLGSDTVFNTCPLSQPNRAVYRCLPPDSGDAAAR